ncbi:putative peptide transporter [Venturia nashicola]|nr:putative peptide transporter [Venturia nashicola]
MSPSHQSSLEVGDSPDTTDKKIPIVETEQSPQLIAPRDATDEEIALHPHITDQVPLSAWIVILAGAAERACYFGIIAPWQNYLQNPRQQGSVPGALGLGQSTATNISNAFFLFSFLTPMGFAVVSDVWLGRYKTLMVGLLVYLLGCLLLTLTSLPIALKHGSGVIGFVWAMILIGLGAGCVKATFFPFLGDQYIQKKAKLVTQKNGKLAIVDATRTVQLIYNIYYWFTNFASLVIIAVTYLEKECDFWVAYLLCTSCLCVAILVLVLFSSKLVKISPTGKNNLPMATKAILCAAKNGFKLENAKASHQTSQKSKQVPWSDSFIEEMKRGLMACRVILCLLIFYLCINQIFNNLVSQAGQMDLHNVPNDMIQVFSGVACVIFGPVIQGLYSLLAQRKISFGPIARITAAFMVCAGAMAYAAGVQKLIYQTGPCYEYPLACEASYGGTIPNQISVWVQLPVYFILAVAEIFGFVTASEYAYSKAPKDMKAMVQAIMQLTACVASALGMALSLVSKDPKLVIMYGCLAVAMAISGVLFFWKFRRYDEKEDEMNKANIQEDDENTDKCRTPVQNEETP